MTTYAVPQFRFEKLSDAIAKLNKRAARLGVEPLRFETTGGIWCDWRFDYERRDLEGKPWRFTYEVVEVELVGGSIKLPGWTFCGTIEHLDGENVLRAVPEQTIPVEYRTATKVCDHCGLDRQRNDTFVVVSDAGEYKQLGRSCTADYLGSVDPQRLASWLEAFSLAVASAGDGDFDSDGGPRTRETYRPDEVVAIANGAIRTYGFVKSAEPGSTKGIIGTWMQGRGKAYEALLKDGMDVTAEDYELSVAQVAWAAEQGYANDYLANLGTYARQERVDGRAMGLLASLPTAYGRAMGQIAERKAIDEKRAAERENATPAPSGRQTIEGIIVGMREQASDYGVQMKLTVLMQAGWRLWVSEPASIAGEVAMGDTVRMTVAVEPSRDDATFAWGKRPTKASVIAHAAEVEEAVACA